MSEMEIEINRGLTSHFIAADPKQVTLLRSALIDNGSGGFTRGPATPLPAPQTMRLIPSNNQLPERETEEGTIANPNLVLMAEWDADIQRFDEFVDQGITYKVLWVYEKRTYQTKADVLTLRRTP